VRSNETRDALRVPTPQVRHRAQASVQGEEPKASLDAGEHDGCRAGVNDCNAARRPVLERYP
jgi:hypothetical protein